MPASNDFNSSSPGSQRAQTPSSRSSDDGRTEDASNIRKDEDYYAQRNSSPIRRAAYQDSPTSPSQARPIKSSPLAHRSGSTISPARGFSSYAHLSPTFGNGHRHSLGPSSRRGENSPIHHPSHPSFPHSASHHTSPQSNTARMDPPKSRSFWDPIPQPDDGSPHSHVGASSPPNMASPSLRDDSRKRNRESYLWPNERTSKSLRTTPSPAATPSMMPVVSDPFDIASDAELAALLGGNPNEHLEEMMEMQRKIEADAKNWKKRDEEREERERRDREYALSLQNELNEGVSPYSTTSSYTPSSMHAGESSRSAFGASGPSYPQGQAAVSPFKPSSLSSNAARNPSQPAMARPIKKERDSAEFSASKHFFTNKGEFIVIPDDSDDEGPPPRGNGDYSITNRPSNSRPSTATSGNTSDVAVMDLTQDQRDMYGHQQRPKVPGSWNTPISSRNGFNNASANGYSSNAVPNAYSFGLGVQAQSPAQRNGYHGSAGSSVYGSGQGTPYGPSSALGQGLQGIYGVGRAMAGAAANALFGGSAHGDFPGYGVNSADPNQACGADPSTSLFPNYSGGPGSAYPGYPGPDLGSEGYPIDLNDDPYGYTRYRAQNKDEVDKQLRSLVDNIQGDDNLGADERTDTPDDMADTAALYKHQILGLAWMTKMEEGTNRGGILADDMGLGKTIQAIALMVSRRSTDPKQKTNLIVAPVALLRQWESEIKIKVKPDRQLSILIYHGKTKGTPWSALRRFDVVLTTYGTLASELRRKDQVDMIKGGNPNWQPTSAKDRLSLLGDDCRWYRIILDEAQNIKNRTTKNAKAVHCLKARYRFCMTGTPMMNNVTELYSPIKFLGIKPYCEWEKFRNDFDKPMRGSYGVDNAMRKFQAFLKAILLRRTKKSEIDGKPIIVLPERNTLIDHAVFDEDQQAFYDSLEDSTKKRFNRYLAKGTVGKNYSNVLELLLRLRQACDHPHLIKGHAEKAALDAAGSASELLKLALDGLTPEAVERLKLMEFLECAICMENADNATIFTPCGHFTCPECYTRVSDPATAEHHEEGTAADTFKFKCMHCRGPVDPKKVTDYASFKQVHMGEAVSAFQEQKEDEAVEDFDLVTDSEGDSDSDSESDAESDGDSVGSLKDFINDDEEEEEAVSSDETDDDLDRPQTKEEFMQKLEEGEESKKMKEQERERAREQEREARVAAVARAPTLVKNEQDAADEGTDEEAERKPIKCSISRSTRNQAIPSKNDSKKDKKPKKGKEKKQSTKKSLSVLQRESRGSAKARAKYMKLLRKRWITSAKIEKCMEILNDVRENHPGEKTIVFSQFTTFLDLVEIPILEDKGWRYTRYDGSMSPGARADAVTDFTTQPWCKVMLVSLKAGNAGLNLTAANNIILLDPFWNPYIEEQAIDRAHRIGQRRPVTIHRILIQDTVEDRIIALQEQKRQVIEGALDEEASHKIGRLSVQDLAYLFGIKSH